MTVIELGMKIGHTQYMNPIHFEVTRSKVKVTVAFYVKTMSAQYLEKFMSGGQLVKQGNTAPLS